MQLSTHRIRRQRWLCRTRSQEEAFSLRGHLREALEETVPAAFERAFDEAVPGGEVLHVPRLELTVRLSRAEDLQAVLPELLRRAAGEQLARLLEPAGRTEPPLRPLRRTEPLPTPAGGTRRSSSREARIETLVRYLTTGTLPWELAQAEAATLTESLRETAREEMVPVLDRAPDASAPLPQSIAFFFRLLQLLPVEKWEEIAAHLFPRLPVSKLQALRRAVTALAGNAQLPSNVRQRLAAVAFAGTRSHPSASESVMVLAEVLAVAPGDVRSRLALLPVDGAAFFGAWLEPGTAGLSGGTPPGVQEAAPGPRLAPDPQRAAVEVPPAETGTNVFPVAVRCAGLVLLHPFLPRLFENRDIDLRRPADLPRAAALLHWLATGRGEVLEWELGLVKVLLGQKPESTLLVGEGLLNDADREEGEALLQAAIGHWKALKGTTPAGLRGSFLQRGGLLREEDAGWRLQVEPAAFDVLLDHLPWGLGVVKLPWMTKPIFTEWPTP